MQPKPRQEAGLLTCLCYMGFFFMGTNAVLFPTLLPSIVNDFYLSLTAVGSVFMYNGAGALMGGLLAGFWSDKMGRKPFMTLMALLNSSALLLAATTTKWELFVLAFLLVGVGQGGFGTTTNALVMDLSQQKQGRGLNRLHASYSIGATLSPFLVTATFHRYNWHRTILVPATFWLLLAIATAILLPKAKGKTNLQRASAQLLRMPVVVQLCLIVFSFNGVAWVLIGWVKKFVQGNETASGWLSTWMIVFFYLGLTVGRLTFSHISDRIGLLKSIQLCALGTALAYPFVILSHALVGVGIGIFLCGLSLSTLFPSSLAYGSTLLPNRRGALAGTMGIAMNLGSMLPPFWTGFIGDHFTLPTAIRANYLLALFLLGVTLFKPKHSETSP